MNALLIAAPPYPPITCRPAARVQAAGPDGGKGQSQHACGWFESSWDLRQGLAVSELPDSDSTVAALWFTRLDNSSARLQ